MAAQLEFKIVPFLIGFLVCSFPALVVAAVSLRHYQSKISRPATIPINAEDRAKIYETAMKGGSV